uniref:uncharacterized protein LOC120340073 n=1 Tax=Styela clava TaxID=7725 RepID=UPI00193A61A1|nr:uncharacterized protein LOC120340073 [Styela clava]
MIDDVYQKITKQMNDMEDKFDEDMERVVSSINNETEHVKDFMGDNEDHVVKAFNNTGDYVSEIVEKQEEQIEEQFEDQTAKIKHNSYEIHKETSKKLDVMGKDISALFKNQDASIDGHISNIREDMTGLFLAQENVLEGQLQYLEKSVLDGLSEKDANFSTALIEFQGDVENGLAHMKKSLINNVEDVSVKVINKIEDMEEGSLRNILSSEEQITRMVEEQDKRIMDLTGGAVFDITNQTTGTETKLIQHLESEGENSRTKISNTLDTSVKAVKAAESKIIVPSEVACSDIDKDRRIECGPQEITLDACEARKCCYDTTITKAIWCFKKETSHYEYFASKYKRFTNDVVDHGSSLLKTLVGLPRSVGNTISDLLEYDVPESCEEIRYHNGRSRGAYGAWYDMNLGRKLERAICSEKNLGWMVLMIFKDASSMVSHADRSFSDYVSGYGTTSENFWAGLENMHRWTSTGTFKLRIELNDFEVGTIVQTYKSFKVGDRNSGYKLSIGSFFAKESDTLITNGDFSSHDGAQFSAKDEGARKSCAVQGGGGWWYKFAPSGTNHACYKLKLTGKRYADPTAKASKEDGITAGPTTILYTGAKMFIKRYYTDTV